MPNKTILTFLWAKVLTCLGQHLIQGNRKIFVNTRVQRKSVLLSQFDCVHIWVDLLTVLRYIAPDSMKSSSDNRAVEVSKLRQSLQ